MEAQKPPERSGIQSKIGFQPVYDWRLACSFPGRGYRGGTAWRTRKQMDAVSACRRGRVGVYLIRLALGCGKPLSGMERKKLLLNRPLAVQDADS